MGRYIDAEKLKEKIKRFSATEYGDNTFGDDVANGALDYVLNEIIPSLQEEQPDLPGIEKSGIPGKDYIPVEWVDACEKYGKWKIVKQEQPELYKDESLGSPDYERGFKHGRDYQTHVERKYTNKDKVIAYLVDKGYPVSTNGEIPTYQETFDMINNAIKHANKQDQPIKVYRVENEKEESE